jgi:acyl carrier protein
MMESAMNVAEKVRDIAAQLLNVDQTTIRPTMRWRSDLDMSSIDFVELLAELENEFDIRIPEADAQQFDTVESVMRYVEEKIATRTK